MDKICFDKELLKPLSDYTTEDVAEFMETMFPEMIKLFREKDKNYNGSWQQRGLLSAQLNFERKTDRIAAQFNNGTITSDTNENIADTLIDTSLYSLMYLFFLYKKSRNVHDQVEEFLNLIVCKPQK